MAKYAGKYIAFSPDGTRILASGAMEEEMEANLIAAEIALDQVAGGYVDPIDGNSSEWHYGSVRR